MIREALSSSPWIPESARPRPPPPKSFIQSVTPSSTYSRIQDWVMKNKILTSVVVIAVGGVTYHIIKRRSHRKKRRAKKAGNGARVEVVVIAGSPSEPLVRSISLDLERRGFIVYIVCNSVEEEAQVLTYNESRPDIKPLSIDITDVSLFPLCQTSTINSPSARQCPCLHRTLHPPHSHPTQRIRRRAPTPPNPPLPPLGPLPKLPFTPHRSASPINAV